MHGDNYEMDMVLDINCELYKVPLGTKLNVLLASTLNLDGTPDEKHYNQVRRSIRVCALRRLLTDLCHRVASPH